MIEYTTGNILTADAEAYVNTVNCVGIMGRGVALQFKNEFPDNFSFYAAACDRGEVQPGRMLVFPTGSLVNPKYIINFPTKRHWRGKSRIEDIESGLEALRTEIERRGIKTIAIPPLGSGLGGLDWKRVRQRIEAALFDIGDVRVIVYEPIGAPEPRALAHVKHAPKMTAGRATLVALMSKYLDGLQDPFVTLVEIHKLMYFMQEAGQPLRLHFTKGHYGPYAENLRHVLRDIEGHLVEGYADGGDQPGKPIELLPGAAKEAMEFLACNADAAARLERVRSLVEGFESPLGLELLATVHWVASESGTWTEDELAAEVYAWGERKKRFSRRQVRIARDILDERGWLPDKEAELLN